MFEQLQKEYNGCYVVLSGGFAAYLEGLTNNFGDVDFFIVSKRFITTDKLARVSKRIFKTLKITEPTLYRITRDPEEEVLVYPSFSRKDRVFYPSLNETICYNIIPVFNKEAQNWQEAAEQVLSTFDLPICAVALTPDFRRLVRFEQASLKIKSLPKTSFVKKLRSIIRREKYRRRARHFGKVYSLQNIVWRHYHTTFETR